MELPVKETEFVSGFHDRLKEVWRSRLWWYKIPTGVFGGARPFDVVAALCLPKLVVTWHYALEFKIERDRRLDYEFLRNDEERKHQWWSLVKASGWFTSAFVIYRVKEKDVVFLPMPQEEADVRVSGGPSPRERLAYLAVWSKKDRESIVESQKVENVSPPDA